MTCPCAPHLGRATSLQKDLLFHVWLSYTSAPHGMIQGPQIILSQNSSSDSNRFTQPKARVSQDFLPPEPPTPLPLSPTQQEKPLPSAPTTAFLQSLNQASQLRSIQLLLTLEITAGSEKQIRARKPAIRGNTNSLVQPLLSSPPPG